MSGETELDFMFSAHQFLKGHSRCVEVSAKYTGFEARGLG